MNNIMEILDMLQFFGGQRSGRELWADKPTDVQDADVESFNKNINAIRDYIQQLEAERDAAVRDCGCFPCQKCEERENGDLCPMCEIQGGFRKFHQWRGVQKEETP